MNRSTPLALVTRLLALTAALCFTTACDDGATDPQPPAADAGPPDAPPPDVGLGITEAARACEVMFFDPQQRIAAVAFGAAVEGRELRRGDRLAVAFAHRHDAPFNRGAIAIAAGGAVADVQIEAAICFDRGGRPLAESGITLDAL